MCPLDDGSRSWQELRGQPARVSVRPCSHSLSGPAQPQEAAGSFPVPGASCAGCLQGQPQAPGWGVVPAVGAAAWLSGARTCDHLLGIVGLHVAVVLPQALGVPLALGAFGIVRVGVVLQDDDLSRERALEASGGAVHISAGVAEMPPAKSQAGKRHAGVPRAGWWLVWGKWSRIATPEDAPSGTFLGGGSADHFYAPQVVVRSLRGALGLFWVTATPPTGSQSSQGCAEVKDQLPRKALHQPLFNRQLSSGVRLAWDTWATMRMPDDPPTPTWAMKGSWDEGSFEGI